MVDGGGLRRKVADCRMPRDITLLPILLAWLGAKGVSGSSCPNLGGVMWGHHCTQLTHLLIICKVIDAHFQISKVHKVRKKVQFEKKQKRLLEFLDKRK